MPDTACGKTTRMVTNFKYNGGGEIVCTRDKPCHCYGRICLVGSKTCSEGYVLFDAKPICGVASGWKKEDAGQVVCEQLGFRRVIDVTQDGR